MKASMTHEEFKDLYGLYVLGSLSHEEQDQLRAHLHTGCVLCQESIQGLTEVLALLPYALPTVQVPSGLKQKLLETIQREGSSISSGVQKEFQQEPRVQPLQQRIPIQEGKRRRFVEGSRRKQRVLTPLFTLVATCIALLLGGYVFLLNQKLIEKQQKIRLLESQLTRQQEEASLFKTQLVQQQQETNALSSQLTVAHDTIATLTAPEVKTITLAGSEKNPESWGKFFLDSTKPKALFYAYNLPPIPAGKTYQLWIIKDKPLSAGIFLIDSNGNAFFELQELPPDAEKIRAVAVTLEPAGGLPQPSGEKYLIGS